MTVYAYERLVMGVYYCVLSVLMCVLLVVAVAGLIRGMIWRRVDRYVYYQIKYHQQDRLHCYTGVC